MLNSIFASSSNLLPLLTDQCRGLECQSLHLQDPRVAKPRAATEGLVELRERRCGGTVHRVQCQDIHSTCSSTEPVQGLDELGDQQLLILLHCNHLPKIMGIAVRQPQLEKPSCDLGILQQHEIFISTNGSVTINVCLRQLCGHLLPCRHLFTALLVLRIHKCQLFFHRVCLRHKDGHHNVAKPNGETHCKQTREAPQIDQGSCVRLRVYLEAQDPGCPRIPCGLLEQGEHTF
mmetsp:Transcript_24874/g.63477  ORF Transcript_24874/g.63477 Transcript_24874/m.63477 type:complete len:233 (-) Transcript_24874:1087-1785(-)